MSKKATPQDTSWFEEMAKRRAAYDASIKDLDSATRCLKCRFIVCRPGVGVDDPRYWTAPWTCGRQEGCIFDVNKTNKDTNRKENNNGK